MILSEWALDLDQKYLQIIIEFIKQLSRVSGRNTNIPECLTDRLFSDAS